MTDCNLSIRNRILNAVSGVEKFSENWLWRSHSPHERAGSAISDAVNRISAGVAQVEAAGADDDQVEEWTSKCLKLWLAYQTAGARTANPMITGPANFPVRRNQKACEAERKRAYEYYNFVDGTSAWMDRRRRSAARAKLSDEAATVEHRTISFPGVSIVQNTVLDRIQIVFEGRPDPEVRDILKGEAFRWSPREGAWQRKNTNNGVQAAYRILRYLGHGKGEA